MDKTFFRRLKSEDEFAEWLQESRENEQFFLSQLSKEERDTLDMSVDSMEWLGKWLTNCYKNLKEAYHDEGIRIVDGAGHYVSNAFLYHFGGDWIVEFEPPDNAYLGFPGITNFKSDGYPLSKTYPRFWATAAIERPDPSFIAKRFNYYFKHLPD